MSTEEHFNIVHGRNTSTAFVLMGENYANLDNSLTNFFFETEFKFEHKRYRSIYGFRMNN